MSATSKEIGEEIEALASATVPGIRRVGEDVARWFDAEALEAITIGDVSIEAGDPLEIKAAAIEIANGSQSTCRGRFYLKRKAHEQLLEAGGAYLLVVYRDERIPVATRVVDAETVDETVDGRWSEVRGSRSEEAVAKVSWGDWIDPDAVEDGDQA